MNGRKFQAHIPRVRLQRREDQRRCQDQDGDAHSIGPGQFGTAQPGGQLPRRPHQEGTDHRALRCSPAPPGRWPVRAFPAGILRRRQTGSDPRRTWPPPLERARRGTRGRSEPPRQRRPSPPRKTPTTLPRAETPPPTDPPHAGAPDHGAAGLPEHIDGPGHPRHGRPPGQLHRNQCVHGECGDEPRRTQTLRKKKYCDDLPGNPLVVLHSACSAVVLPPLSAFRHQCEFRIRIRIRVHKLQPQTQHTQCKAARPTTCFERMNRNG